MKILVINSWSSSLKYQLFDTDNNFEVLAKGLAERIWMPQSVHTLKFNGEKEVQEIDLPNHEVAIKLVIDQLLSHNIISSLEEIRGIGHRVVQGWDYFDKSVVINSDVLNKIEELCDLAPLHNPAAITWIQAAMTSAPNATQTAAFDTAFHQTMPEENYMYAVPYEWHNKYKIRRYGAHGTSHKYVAQRMNEILWKEDTKIITCHIGNGASISAVKNGKCINTSMGLTPNAGMVMGTRCGDIDATIVPFMMDKLKLTPKEMDTILNKESWLLGISGVSSDSRDIENGIKEGNARCILAQNMFNKRIIDYIAKYYVELGGCDGIVFTAWIGENSIDMRKEVLEWLAVLGIKVDVEANNCRGKEVKITTDDSKIPCYVIPTDEELMIAKDTYELIK